MGASAEAGVIELAILVGVIAFAFVVVYLLAVVAGLEHRMTILEDRLEREGALDGDVRDNYVTDPKTGKRWHR